MVIRDGDLAAPRVASLAAAAADHRALDHLAKRIVDALASGGALGSLRATIDHVRVRYAAVAERAGAAGALARGNVWAIEGMRLALEAAANAWPPAVWIGAAELAGALARIEIALLGGDHAGARSRFGALAVAALRSPDVHSVLAYRVPDGCAPELRGWAPGLALLLVARTRLTVLGW